MNNFFISFFLLFLLFSCSPRQTLQTQVDTIFSEFRENTPGVSVLIKKDGKVIFKKGYGLANLENKTPITPKTNFRLASITKQFTAYSIMLLEQERKLSFDDNLTRFFPDFPSYGRKITIRNILHHTSGLLAYEENVDDTVTAQLKDEDVLKILMKQDSTYFEPGTKHRYSNSGYVLLALIVEKLSGKTFAEFLKERLFTPLNMTKSIAYEKGVSEVSNRAFGYTKTDSGFVFTDQSLYSAVLGDGGIYSSTLDLVKWDSEISNPVLLPKKKFESALQKFCLPNGDTVNYGFGWRLDPYRNFERPYHTGGTSGFSNIYMKIPALDLTIIVLINIRNYDAKGYAEKIADIFIDENN